MSGMTRSYSARWILRALTSILTLCRNLRKSSFYSQSLLMVSQSSSGLTRAGYTTRDSLKSASCR